MKTPMNNLEEPHFPDSSLTPGVSGESVNAPFGPKAAEECGIMEGKAEADMHNYHQNGFTVGQVTGLPEPDKDESSLKP
jgi:hypothetical protein